MTRSRTVLLTTLAALAVVSIGIGLRLGNELERANETAETVIESVAPLGEDAEQGLRDVGAAARDRALKFLKEN